MSPCDCCHIKVNLAIGLLSSRTLEGVLGVGPNVTVSFLILSKYICDQQGKQCFQRWNRCIRFMVVRLSCSIPWDLNQSYVGYLLMLNNFCFYVHAQTQLVSSDVNISEMVYPIYLKINVRRVAGGDSLHFNF